jgi:class 3 adenylate cyclase/tetratricopeptide (TPR) repeat protein
MGVPPRGRADPVAVAPFIGRFRELGSLQQWLGESRAGHPRIALIQGEAGIGKTRLLHEARSMARRLGVDTYFGRCHEDLALPYLPFVEALRPPLERPSEALRRALGNDLQVIRRLVHGGGPGGGLPRAPGPEQADHDKVQLLLAMGNAVVKLAQGRPALVAIDDVHWADTLSMDLFEHLAFAVSDMATREAVPLLIVGTHRTPAGDERLARLIARLQREETCRTMMLEGLSEEEIRELLGGLGLARPSQQLTATVTDATGGNPLFVREVVHQLVRQDALHEQGGYLVTTAAASDVAFPEQVTVALSGRAQDVSEPCRRVLRLASFLGDRVALPTLAAVSGMADDELLTLLEEAMRHEILRNDGETFAFAHPMLRAVFYQEPSLPGRQRLHRHVAEALERLYGSRAAEHVLEIAHHVVRAGPATGGDRMLAYARRAAERAFSLSAWSDAARYYEAALAAGPESVLSTGEEAELHYRAGLAHYYAQDIGPCVHHYERAIEAYRGAGDLRGLARALMERTRTSLAIVPLGTVVDLTPLQEAAAALGDEDQSLRGHITAVMAEAYRNGRQAEAAKQHGHRALEIGRQLADDPLCAYASFALGLASINDLDVRGALDCWEGALVHARRAGDFIREGRALHRIPLALTLLGRLGEADAVAVKACESTRRSRDWGNHSLGLSHMASVAAARGDFDRVERHAHETMVMVSRSRFPWGGFRSLLALAGARAHRGAWTEAHDALDVLVEPGRVFDDAGRIVHAFARVFRQLLRLYAEGGDGGVERLVDDVIGVIGTDTYSLAPLCALVELSEAAGLPAAAEQPRRRLARAAARGVVFSSGWMFLVPRVLGVAAALQERWDDAAAHFGEAIDVATAAGARAELARTYLDYARMLGARRGDDARAEAGPLVEGAGRLFRELGMSAFAWRADQLARTLHLEVPGADAPETAEYPDNLSDREVDVLIRMARGRTHDDIAHDLIVSRDAVDEHLKNILEKTRVGDQAGATVYAADKGLVGEPAGQTGAARALRIILVSDIVASSALIRRSGDVKAHYLMQRHNALLRGSLAAHEGTEVTHTGDGIEAAFTTASNAVDCAVDIQKALARHNRDHPADGIRVRIGLNAGEPIATEGRLFGAAVHAAFGICARAGPGQILVSDVVAQLLEGKGVRLVPHGRVALKGLGRMRLHEVVWEEAR